MIALFAADRAIHFAGLMTIFGAGSYAALLRIHLRIDLPDVRRLFVVAAALALLSAMVWLCLVAGQMSGDWTKAFDPAAVAAVVTDTRFGQIFVARLAILTMLLVTCLFKSSSQSLLPAGLAALALIALGFTSHAAASDGGGALAVARAVNDATHLLAGGFWIGGLLVLAMLMQRYRSDAAALLGPLRLFSMWGTYAVAALVFTGLTNAASILTGSAASLRSAYVGILLTKILLALAMIVLATLNRWRVAPAMRGGTISAAHHLGRNIAAEIALGLVVISIAGILGLMPPQ